VRSHRCIDGELCVCVHTSTTAVVASHTMHLSFLIIFPINCVAGLCAVCESVSLSTHQRTLSTCMPCRGPSSGSPRFLRSNTCIMLKPQPALRLAARERVHSCVRRHQHAPHLEPTERSCRRVLPPTPHRTSTAHTRSPTQSTSVASY
jgi:hypothetical protein